MKWLSGCLLRLLIVLVSVVGFTFLCCFIFLQQVKSFDPRGWDEGVTAWLGLSNLSSFPGYILSQVEEEVVKKLGLKPELVARASATEATLDGLYGQGHGDRSLYVSLTKGESGDGANCGTCFATAEYAERPVLLAGQRACLEELVAIWKEWDIRARDPLAAKYIPEDYDIDKIIGSCGGGALGPGQFEPCTFLRWVKEGKIQPPANIFSKNTAMLAMGLENHANGWRKGIGIVEGIQVLMKWNPLPSWIAQIYHTAKAYLGYLGTRTGILLAGTAISTGSLEWSEWKTVVATGLDWMGLLPDAVQATTRGAQPRGSLPLPSLADGHIVADLATEVPQNDGEKENVILWAESNSRLVLKPNKKGDPAKDWDFCTQTDETGWGQYSIAAGILAGGICFNASVIDEAVKNDPRIIVVKSSPHEYKPNFPGFTKVIACPGVTQVLRNISDEAVTLVWSRDGDKLYLSSDPPIQPNKEKENNSQEQR